MEQDNSNFSCRICGNGVGNEWYQAREMMYGFRDKFWYVQCSRCECLQIKEIPEDISKYYPSKYYSFAPYDGYKFEGFRGRWKTLEIKAAVFQDNLVQKGISTFLLNHKYDSLKLPDISRESRVLDVGSGNGEKFLYPLAEAGVKQVLGCDPFISENLSYKNGLKIKKTDIFGIYGEWDLITFHHSYEHIERPVETLQKAAELLAPEGSCMIRIPTVSFYAWKQFKTDWYQLDAPRHFFLHSVKSMELIAEKAGLELYKILYDSVYSQFTESKNYQKDIPLITPQGKGFGSYLKRKIIKTKYRKMANKLNKKNLGDQAAFFFRKRRQDNLED